MRLEDDGFGEIEVPQDRYWGPQTQRSLRNFPIGAERMPVALIRAYALVKKAACAANAELGVISERYAAAIDAACDEIVAGRLDEEFPLMVWQTGSGTQTNMNVNEVIANRATELLGRDFRTEKQVHPNDHVNANQSSNDTFPTAMHIAVYQEIESRLLPALRRLHGSLLDRAEAFAKIVKTGRTHLMDAMPMTLGQEFSGYGAQLAAGIEALESALPRLAEVALGGTGVGTGFPAPAAFADRSVRKLADLSGLPLVPAANRFAGISAHDALVETHGCLKRLAVSLMFIADQIRLLASGPRTGLGELLLPANEPGSSIMPGKVNPTQCEALTMVCAAVMGNDTTVTVAGSQGHLQLNTYKPVLAYCTLQSIALLSDASASFEERCVRGIAPNLDRIAEYRRQSLMLVTALTPRLGYDKGREIVRKAAADNLTLRDAAAALGYLTPAEFDALVDPARMTRPRD